MDRLTNSIIDYVNSVERNDLLGENNNFRLMVNKFVEKIVSQGKWFGFGTRVDNSQIDIFSLTNSYGFKLGSLVIEQLNTEEGYRTSLYRYLLHDFLCYCEIPTVVKQKDYSGFKDSYIKNLVTSNLHVIANWLGISYEDAVLQYGSRLDRCGMDRSDSMYPYVKLVVAKDGTRKVTKPRKDLDLSINGIRITPVFALKTGVSLLYKICSEDFYNVTFVKDSGQVRTVNICFDYDKLSSVYTDKGLLANEFEEQFKGDFMSLKTLERGYIRVIEVGTNLKNHAVRSINIARILKIEKAEPDLTFINVDLDSVKSSFLSMTGAKNINYKEFVDMLDLFNVGNSRKYNGKLISSYPELENWVELQEITLSTPFIKQLALFMMGNPQWFDGYTGECKTVVSQDFEGFDDDLDFDI